MWKNEKDNDREKRRVRGRKRREREIEGKAPAFVGGLSIVIFFGAWMGVITGFRGFKERDKNYVTCKIGVACNLAILACFVGIFIRGLL